MTRLAGHVTIEINRKRALLLGKYLRSSDLSLLFERRERGGANWDEAALEQEVLADRTAIQSMINALAPMRLLEEEVLKKNRRGRPRHAITSLNIPIRAINLLDHPLFLPFTPIDERHVIHRLLHQARRRRKRGQPYLSGLALSARITKLKHQQKEAAEPISCDDHQLRRLRTRQRRENASRPISRPNASSVWPIYAQREIEHALMRRSQILARESPHLNTKKSINPK